MAGTRGTRTITEPAREVPVVVAEADVAEVDLVEVQAELARQGVRLA